MNTRRQSTQKEAKGNADERLRRLTVDLPESLHRKLKFKSFDKDIPMTDLVRQMLEKSLR